MSYPTRGRLFAGLLLATLLMVTSIGNVIGQPPPPPPTDTIAVSMVAGGAKGSGKIDLTVTWSAKVANGNTVEWWVWEYANGVFAANPTQQGSVNPAGQSGTTTHTHVLVSGKTYVATTALIRNQVNVATSQSGGQVAP